jgi:DNA-binding CsgD family transcriptional regulator
MGHGGTIADERFVDPAIGAAPAGGLCGRNRELSVLFRLVDRSTGGGGGALVLRGDPGIGKSALLAAAAARAREHGVRVLTGVGVQSEARLPFAGLHQLLMPVLARADDLPPRLRRALFAGFGDGEQAAAEPFLIALATLQLISDTADDAPVLVIVEDADWLDQPTCAVLAFVARRLATEPAAMVIAMRDGRDGPLAEAGLPELRLYPLGEAAAAELLDRHAGDLGPMVRQRLLEEALGNPLALVELPAAARSERIGEDGTLPARLPLTARLERAFARQQSELPAATRAVLLIAAADDGEVLAEVLSAASIVAGGPVPVDALAPAVSIGLVEVRGSTLHFRHPLVRSAIYQSATWSQRQAAHTALSDVLADRPDRRVWHRSAAALGPDEDLAAELDLAAARAERRGAVAVAVSAQERAAELSGTPRSRGARLLRAAELAFDLGRQASGHRLLAAAEPLDLEAPDRTRLTWLREIHDTAGWPESVPADALAAIAPPSRTGGDPRLALKLLRTAAVRCWWSNPADDTRAAVVAAARRLGVPQDEPALLTVRAHADPVRQGADVIARISKMRPNPGDPARMHLVGSAAAAVWAYDLAVPFLDMAVHGLRAQGRLGLLAQALVTQAWALVHLAREPLAVAAAEEAWRLARETGQPRFAAAARFAQATIAAERGDFDTAESLVSEAEGLLLSRGTTPMLAMAQFVRGRGAVAHHRYAEGFEHHRRTLDPADPAYHPFIGAWGLSDLVEAAAHNGRPVTARMYLKELESLAAATSGTLLRAQAAFARPLIATDADADALYRTAVDRELRNWPCYRGRMLLLYGRWLRRRRRVTESRGPLRAAREGFDALAFPRLAEAARQELRASGETSRRRVPEAWDLLTPQELQIARLAAEGLSNREIGEQLYLSHRTVGYHLHRIFPKLGIASRTQLHAAVAGAVNP